MGFGRCTWHRPPVSAGAARRGGAGAAELRRAHGRAAGGALGLRLWDVGNP